jgi:hypothetical protein
VLKGGDRFDQLSEDDPNYEIGKLFYLEAWADSHALVAEGFSGRLSFSDFVESCIRTFCQAAEAQVAFKDDTSVSARCQELDRMASKFIRKFKQKLRAARQRLGKATVEAAVAELSQRVSEIAALSKQQILDGALAKSPHDKTRTFFRPYGPKTGSY